MAKQTALVNLGAAILKILDRYIGRVVIGGTILVMLVLLPLLSFLELLEQLDDIGKGRYGLLQAFQYVLLSMPRLTYESLPMAALMGSLLGLGTLASNHELVAMRAAGISLRRIIRAVMKMGLWLIVAVILIGEFVAPSSTQSAKTLRATAKADQIALRTQYGFWARDGFTYINIRQIFPAARLGDLYIYEFDDQHRLRLSTYARRAYYSENQWILEDIQQSHIEEDRVITARLSQASWESLLEPGLLSAIVGSSEHLPARSLYKYIDFLRANGLDTHSYVLAFWTKVAAPLVTLVSLYLAIPIVFGSVRTMGIGQRILIGIIVGIGFSLFNEATAQMGLVYHLNPLFSAFFPVIVCFAVATWVLSRLT